MTEREKRKPYIKAATDGEKRIVLHFKSCDPGQFNDLLATVKAIPGAKFDRDDRRWNIALTMENCKRLREIGEVEASLYLLAWIADRSIAQRMNDLETEIGRLRERIDGARKAPSRKCEILTQTGRQCSRNGEVIGDQRLCTQHAEAERERWRLLLCG